MRTILKLRESLYAWKWLRSVRLPAYVISVGNISLGGTGKSPLAVHLCEWAVAQGLRPLLLSRGYGRSASGAVFVAAGEPPPPAELVGDEPRMLKERVPGTALLVHAARVREAASLWGGIKADIVVLDDAFQHWQAVRDLDLVVLDAREDLHQPTLPFGRLREPVETLSRADAVIINRSNEVTPAALEELQANVREWLAKTPPAKPWQNISGRKGERPVFLARYVLETLHGPGGEKLAPASALKGEECVLLSGIGRPESFRHGVEALGAKIVASCVFPDHHRLNASDWQKIRRTAAAHPGARLLATEKDWSRWREEAALFPRELCFLRGRLEFTDPQAFSAFLETHRKCTIL